MRERKSRSFRRRMIALVVIIVVVASLGGTYYIYGNKLSSEPNKVILRTSMGDITILLYDDMPITTGNFRNLVRQGVYDGTLFHRVVPNFVIQGGDATSKGITVPTIKDEFPGRHSNVRGSVAMAKTSQKDSATSQFYINLNDTNAGTLDSNYSVFGEVTSGMDVVDRIGQVATDANEKPLTDIILTKAEFTTT